MPHNEWSSTHLSTSGNQIYTIQSWNVRCQSALDPLQTRPDFVVNAQATALDPAQKDRYQALVGELRYLADSTRLDIAYATARLAQLIHKPITKHSTLLHYVLRYLIRTVSHGILYAGKNSIPLTIV